MLEEISPQEQDQDAHIDLAQHRLLLFDGKRSVPMACQEVGCPIVVPLYLRGGSNHVGGILGVRGSHTFKGCVSQECPCLQFVRQNKINKIAWWLVTSIQGAGSSPMVRGNQAGGLHIPFLFLKISLPSPRSDGTFTGVHRLSCDQQHDKPSGASQFCGMTSHQRLDWVVARARQGAHEQVETRRLDCHYFLRRYAGDHLIVVRGHQPWASLVLCRRPLSTLGTRCFPTRRLNAVGFPRFYPGLGRSQCV